jgi:hypothetical protein
MRYTFSHNYVVIEQIFGQHEIRGFLPTFLCCLVQQLTLVRTQLDCKEKF